MKRMLSAVALLVAATTAQAEPDWAGAVREDYRKDLAAIWSWFHQNPELGFREIKTAARMAAELRRVSGVVVTEKVGQTGIVGVLKNGDGPVVQIRADMDALPIEEKSGLPNASKVRQMGSDGVEHPVAHLCGHDAHITSLIGTARRLVAMKDRWRGTVVFVVQPAEEILAGAKAMLEDGLYTRFPKPDYVIGFHVRSQLPTGKVSGAIGLNRSSADRLDIVIPGVGAHAASPQSAKDPVYMGAQLVIALQGLISRERFPLDAGVVTVGTFLAGNKSGAIPDEARLQVSVLANDEVTRRQLIEGVRRIARGVATLNGMPENKMPTVTPVASNFSLHNDADLARQLDERLAATFGAENVLPYKQLNMASDDIAQFFAPGLGVKGFYFDVGGTPQAAFDAAAAGGPPVPSHHSPLFKIDAEPVIVTGIIATTAVALDLLDDEAKAKN